MGAAADLAVANEALADQQAQFGEQRPWPPAGLATTPRNVQATNRHAEADTLEAAVDVAKRSAVCDNEVCVTSLRVSIAPNDDAFSIMSPAGHAPKPPRAASASWHWYALPASLAKSAFTGALSAWRAT